MINRKDKKLVILPPKTGTVSFESVFVNPFCGFEPYTRRGPNIIHMYIEEAIGFYNIQDIQDWTIYQTARNPMDRVPSAFFHQKKMVNRDREPVNVDFEYFVEYLNENRHILTRKGKKIFEFYGPKDVPNTTRKQRNGGLRFYIPQTLWANPDKYNVKYIKLGEDNSQVYADMGLPEDLEIPHWNDGENGKNGYEYLHTDKTREIIKSLYEEDFLRINYEQP